MERESETNWHNGVPSVVLDGERFSELLALVEKGGEVIVCRRTVPLARVESTRKPAPGRRSRAWWVA